MTSEVKRCKSKNFSYDEVDLLLNLVDFRKGVLENKKTDQITSKEKNVAWKGLEEEFNQKNLCGDFRDWKMLKTKYENLKKAAKKNFAEERRKLVSWHSC